MDNYSYQLYAKIMNTFWRIFLVVLAILGLKIVFPFVKDVLIMFIIALLLSVLLAPLVNLLERHGLHRGVAILIVMLFIVGTLAFSISLIIPGLIRTVESLSSKLQSNMISDLSKQAEIFFAEKFNNPELAQNLMKKAQDIGLKLLGSLASFSKSVGSFLASMVIVPFITFFLIKDNRKFKRGLICKVPNKYFELALNIQHKLGDQVSKYIQGQAIDALIVGLLATLGLFIINLVFDNPVSYFVFIGMVAGIANLIPYLGPIVGAVPALTIAIINNPPHLGMVLLWIAIVFVIVQSIDNSLVSPLVVSKSVNMHPLTVVVAIIIGGNLAGVIGMLFAVPMVGIIKVCISEVSWGLRSYRL